MRIFFTLGIVLFLFSGTASADEDGGLFLPKKPEVKKPNLQFGFGGMSSVLYLSRNIKEKNDAYGYAFHVNYGGNKLFRFSMQYTYYKPINIEPTWYNIYAQTIEANLEVLARFPNGKSFLYPMAGLSYNTFSGFFTGFNDFLNLREYYAANSTVKTRWLGVNVGTGFEHAIGPIVLFMDYRMRVGTDRGGINIMDVCYGFGVRIKPSVLPIYIGKIFKPTKNKYTWIKN
ncbi:MAG: hypothetical protein ACXVPQ_03105 [Bacteroidia bacterium]